MVNGINTYNQVHGLTEQEESAILAYLQGAVYCWCKNVGTDKWFAARDFLGGENFDWKKTPMEALFNLYQQGDKSRDAYAIEQAGKAAGWLLLRVLVEDQRVFDTREGYTREYCWKQ